jgi:hypothetical protein
VVLFLFRIKSYFDQPEGSATLKWPAMTALKSASSCAYRAARLASAASGIRKLEAVIFIWAQGSQLMLGVEEIRVLANETRDDKPRSKMPRIGGRLRKASSNGVQARL